MISDAFTRDKRAVVVAKDGYKFGTYEKMGKKTTRIAFLSLKVLLLENDD